MGKGTGGWQGRDAKGHLQAGLKNASWSDMIGSALWKAQVKGTGLVAGTPTARQGVGR